MARSRTAALLVENNFKQVYEMGDINGWTAKGYPAVEKK